MGNKLFLDSGPCIRHSDSVFRIYWILIFFLLPSFIYPTFLFGAKVIQLLLLGIVYGALLEYTENLITRSRITAFDGDIIFSCLLFVMTLPIQVPIFLLLLGCTLLYFVGKYLFGGLGYGFLSAVVLIRVFFILFFPEIFQDPYTYLPGKTFTQLNHFLNIVPSVDPITSTTPLGYLKNGIIHFEHWTALSTWGFLLGKKGGAIGEMSNFYLFTIAFFLFAQKILNRRVPLIFISSFFLFVTFFLFIQDSRPFSQIPYTSLFLTAFFHIFSGPLILGAIFVATDFKIMPFPIWGQWVFAIGCGFLSVWIRLFGDYYDGVFFSIFSMSFLSALINQFTKPTIYGWRF